MIAWVIHILELIAGIFGVGVGIWGLPDAASALEVVTPTAVGLVGLLAFSLLMIYLAVEAMIQAGLSLR
jgi:hypothetical protein